MPPVPKQVLLRYGREVARLRTEAELTQTALAHRVQSSKSQISDVERGKAPPSPALRKALDGTIGFGRLSRLWEDLTGSNRAPWLSEIATAIQEAEAIWEYQALALPSYLQVERYAHTLIRTALPWLSPDELAKSVEERVTRAKNFAESLRPLLWLVLDETLIHRRYGGVRVAKDQLTYLADLAESGRITLQIMPADHTGHPGNSGSFRVITMRDATELAYVESAEEGRILTSPTVVAQRRMLLGSLQGLAWEPETSLRAVREEVKRLVSD
ncbi:helix-turn-helix transcriptional regulator [Nocardiopsis sp. N85]|uniref:helix-turn-helix domain-containing protein n=1 Tax=Nocardiopsis sp. N85 TaxID=3029400 RepID=UPI00237FA5EE|nr:helix-turn-helix transcriptional regulator [Nocardiopsis sp. N85]MDE3724183.1 helix-turn-helix transcriptional regulator [Nocardiopsis sp. N85]